MGKKWSSIFSVSHCKLFDYNKTAGRTIRIVIPNNVAGSQIRIRLSNQFGETEAFVRSLTVAPCDKNGVIETKSLIQVTKNGDKEIRLAAGEDCYTDQMPICTEAGGFLAVSLFFPEQPEIRSGNNLGKYSLRSFPGDYTTKTIMDIDPVMVDAEYNGMHFQYEPESPVPVFKSLEILGDEAVRVIAVLGDSIAAMALWTKPFTERLYAKCPGRVVLNNAGINGNAATFDTPKALDHGMGNAAVKRFERDILDLAGITHCIISVGTNDLTYHVIEPGTKPVSFESMTNAFITISKKAHEKGIRVIGMPILPRGDYMMTTETERLRKEINQFIRENDMFDAVLDYEKVVIKEDGSREESFFQADNLHINAECGKRIAELLDISTMLGEQV